MRVEVLAQTDKHVKGRNDSNLQQSGNQDLIIVSDTNFGNLVDPSETQVNNHNNKKNNNYVAKHSRYSKVKSSDFNEEIQTVNQSQP